MVKLQGGMIHKNQETKQMDINSLRQWFAERDSISILETVDVHTGVRSILKEFDYVIEAPNWTRCDLKSRLFSC
jgi:hypothetical protein